ncbi:HAMP domain-containing histidine kinase [Aquibium sp. A9E412]|uniref:sensor histidine kinase n=1 Tax=Aquibium sp. A9E412 TaxID=2976767 RepID=UPI0025AF3E99|nr:HAMP domain-containing sensor histidine kinase [Aquibium sp. A9E412]MDN2565614.1 HAMP domain-containing histidine kinase [Aquibium sp. A9E412]
MSGRRGVLAYPFSLAAILAFTGLLAFALWRLSDTEAALRNQAGDNMLWAISQAQVAARQLDATLGRARLGEADAEALRLRYDVLYSRLDLLEAGPQRRYLAALGHDAPIRALAAQVYAREGAFLSAGATGGSALHELLARLATELGRAANGAMVAQWDETGAQLDRQRGAILQVIAAGIVVLALGAFLSVRMLAALQAEQRAQMSLLREQEIREAYRGFVALVSHQFRTPLSVIDASMQRIQRRGEAMPRTEIAERARRVRDAVGRLTALMQATLDSMKLDAGRIEIALADCAIAAELEAARQRQLEAWPGRTVAIDIGDAVPARFTADPLLLQQILGNLLANALAHSPRTEPVTLRARARGGRLLIAVIDRGVGIPEAEKDSVFQPYFRASTAARADGVGIGLHLSRRLARMLGGEISFESRHGVGSTFTLDLPL